MSTVFAQIIQLNRIFINKNTASCSCSLSIVPPDIIDAPVDITEIDDNNVMLSCFALGFPQPSITWMYQRMRSDVATVVITTSSSDPNMKYQINNTVNTTSFGTLTITNLQYDDRGVYTCVAADVNGAVSAAAVVSVHGKDDQYVVLTYMYIVLHIL